MLYLMATGVHGSYSHTHGHTTSYKCGYDKLLFIQSLIPSLDLKNAIITIVLAEAEEEEEEVPRSGPYLLQHNAPKHLDEVICRCI